MSIRFFTQSILKRSDVEHIANKLSSALNKQAFIGGSYARGKSACNDADLLFCLENEEEIELARERLESVGFRHFKKKPYVSAGLLSDDVVEKAVVDVFFCTAATWGNASLFVVGSKKWNDLIRYQLDVRNMNWDDIRYFTDNGEKYRLSFSTEEEALQFVGVDYKPNEER